MRHLRLILISGLFYLTGFSQGSVSIDINPNNPTISDDIYLKTNVYFTSAGILIDDILSWQGNQLEVDLYYKQGGQQSPTFIEDSIQIGLLNEGTYSIIVRLMVKNQPGSDTDLQNYVFRDSDSIVFRVEESLGLFDNKINGLAISIYPNPTKNHLNFSLKDNSNSLQIEIIDVTGKQVKAKRFLNQEIGEFKNAIDISDLKKGLYFCKFSNGENQVTRKFIKQ
jgi:hypothetical protein